MKPYFVNRDYYKISTFYREFAYALFAQFMNTLYIFGIIIKNNMHKKYKLSDNSHVAFYPYLGDEFGAEHNNACSTNRLVIKTTVTALKKMPKMKKTAPPFHNIIHFGNFVNIQKKFIILYTEYLVAKK